MRGAGMNETLSFDATVTILEGMTAQETLKLQIDVDHTLSGA